MLDQGVTIFPDNLTAGTAGEETMVARQGLIEGRELRRLGVDVNFGPCLDVLTERYSPNIGIRSYGKDPALVARFGAARIRGMQAAGRLGLRQALPRQGARAGRRAPGPAGHRLRLGRHARGPPACRSWPRWRRGWTAS